MTYSTFKVILKSDLAVFHFLSVWAVFSISKENCIELVNMQVYVCFYLAIYTTLLSFHGLLCFTFLAWNVSYTSENTVQTGFIGFLENSTFS